VTAVLEKASRKTGKDPVPQNRVSYISIHTAMNSNVRHYRQNPVQPSRQTS